MQQDESKVGGANSTSTKFKGHHESPIVPLKLIEYGFKYIFIRSPNTPYSICLRGTINLQDPLRGWFKRVGSYSSTAHTNPP